MRYLLLVCCFMVMTGCAFGPQKYEAYHPQIPDLQVYPGFKSKQQYWADKSKFYESLKGKAQFTPAETLAILTTLFDLDTLVEAREKQIAAYNQWAAAQNVEHGYKGDGDGR